jgi:uncharacterized protein (TIGR00106 family)
MALLEFSVTPLGQGESVGEYVRRAIEVIDRSGLNYEVHAMGTIVEGDLSAVLDVMRQCIEALQADCDRVTCTAKLDCRRGHPDQLRGKLQSLEKRIGRPLGRSSASGGAPA